MSSFWYFPPRLSPWVFHVFLNFKVRVWDVSCLIGVCILVSAFVFRPTDSPRSVLGSGWPLFFVCLLLFFRPADPPHSVLGHGWANRAAKLRRGTIGFSCSFFFFVLPTPSSPPSRGAARVIWLLTLWHRIVCFCLTFFVMHVILFSLCYTFSARRFPLLATVGWTTFSFSCWFLSFVSPSYHDDSLREGFVVGFPCLSACVLLQFALLRLAPPPR